MFSHVLCCFFCLYFRIFAQKESKYSNEKIEELKEVMLELEVMLWVSFNACESVVPIIVIFADKT